MKIEIGPDGRILGTKRVSPNGQVSGFTEYAGLDVLVILPGGSTPVVRRDAKDLLREAEALVNEQMQVAFSRYNQLRERYGSPEKAAKSFLKKNASKNFRGLVAKADQWVRDQLAHEEGPRSRAHPRKKKE